jgi:BirA family biotin operon repressor/biotin-[acetyl-CoA-carboxylase] ligase
MKTPAPREIILSLFRQTPDGFVSGERISDELGVSRTAVWKHIRNLRQAGYQIEAIPSRGYQLQQSPDGLVSSRLMRRIRPICRPVASVMKALPTGWW